MQEEIFAEILLPLAIDSTYTYSVPQQYIGILKPGFKVIVNLGKRKLYSGIVVDIHSNKPEFAVKPILEIPESYPIISVPQFALIKWTSQYYCCSQGETLAAAIPSKLIPSSETKVFYNNIETDFDPGKSEIKILDMLKNQPVSDINKIVEATEIKNPIKHLEILERAGLISLGQNIVKPYKQVFKSFVSFRLEDIKKNEAECEKILKRNNKQALLLSFLTNHCADENISKIEIEEKQICETLDVSKATIKSLEEKNLVKIVKREESRFKDEFVEIDQSFVLSQHQQTAFNQIKDGFINNRPVLLHGVTSSGKTEIYIKLIEEVVSKGKQVLYLLPETALTSQIISRLKKYFGNNIGIFHSKYSVAARSELYLSVLNSEVKIILGVRSAVLLPFSNLGLVIVDEEHETTYKQQNPDPRYNARDLSLVLSKIHKANVILGSATPSSESYFNAKNEKYALVELSQRFGDVKMPEIIIANLQDAYRRKLMTGHFHPELVNNIKTALENREQVVLFQNRRGYSPTVECKDCGWVPYCKTCNVSLTYHKYENKLVCHYCTEKYNVIKQCPKCGSTSLSFKGFGTEKIEDEAAVLFPEARIGRLDYDTANSRLKYERIINDFENHRFDILIGTQMVTKGLDFERLSLVGILNADNLLTYPDYRAYERAYQLMAQVSGRAGRRSKQGKVIIQTYNPDNLIIDFVKANNYQGMFNSQLAEREAFKYPPFWSFIIIKLKHKDDLRLNRAATFLAEMLRNDFHERVKGPEQPLINKISNYYMLNIHLRFEKTLSAPKVKAAIIKKIKQLKSESEFGSVISEIDVDPI